MTKKDVKNLVLLWRKSASEDWSTSLSLKRGKRYGPCLFYLHLSLEKRIKALIVHITKDHPPFGHHLVLLLGRTGLEVPQEILEDLQQISVFNVQARYPADRDKIYKSVTLDGANLWQKKAKKINSWLDRFFEKNF